MKSIYVEFINILLVLAATVHSLSLEWPNGFTARVLPLQCVRSLSSQLLSSPLSSSTWSGRERVASFRFFPPFETGCHWVLSIFFLFLLYCICASPKNLVHFLSLSSIFSLSLCATLFVNTSVYMYVSPPSLSFFLSVFLSLSYQFSFFLFLCVSHCLSGYYLSVYWSVGLSVYLSVSID